MERIRTYEEFWPFYLTQHSRKGTRALHLFGTALALVLLAAGIVTEEWGLLVTGIVAGYAFAWLGHLAIERNQPATFRYPLWSLYSDLRMLWLFVADRLDDELQKHAVEEEPPPPVAQPPGS